MGKTKAEKIRNREIKKKEKEERKKFKREKKLRENKRTYFLIKLIGGIVNVLFLILLIFITILHLRAGGSFEDFYQTPMIVPSALLAFSLAIDLFLMVDYSTSIKRLKRKLLGKEELLRRREEKRKEKIRRRNEKMKMKEEKEKR